LFAFKEKSKNMKQKYLNITFIALAFGALLLFSSCKTNQRGIIPCPSYSSVEANKSQALPVLASDDNEIKPTAD
jgi:hypothetical protein